MKELEATKLASPVALTEHEAEAVAGGLVLSVGRLGVCPGCTSGGYFNPQAALAQVVNPAESFSVG